MIDNTFSFETSYNYGVGVRYTDNSLLAEKNPSNDLSVNTAAGFTILDDTPRVIYSLNADLLYRKYTQNTLPDRTYYNLVGDMIWTIRPSTLTWQVNDNLSLQSIDQLNKPLPSNIQQVNIFTTGPSYIYRISAVNNLLLDYRFYDVKNEVTNTDNKRNYYLVAVDHKISEVSTISLNYADTAVKYKDTVVNNNFNGEAVFVTFDAVNAKSAYNMSAGISRATLVTTGEEFESNFLSLIWDYQINFSSNLSARYRKGLSDAVNDINLSNFLNSGIVNTANLNDTSIFTAENIFVSYNQIKTNWQATYSLYGAEQDYGTARATQTTVGGDIIMDYSITGALYLTGLFRNVKRKTLSINEQRIVDHSYSIGTRYYISSELQFVTNYTHNIRNSNQVGRSYDENVISISIEYSNGRLAARLQ